MARDAEGLHRALEESAGQVHVALSRDTAELVSRLVGARGEEIVIAPGDTEVRPPRRRCSWACFGRRYAS